MLNEANFKNIEKNSLPLKIFRDLFLSGGLQFNSHEFFKIVDNKFEYSWLLELLMGAKYLGSLQAYTQLKKQLQIFVETEVVPFIVMAAKS